MLAVEVWASTPFDLTREEQVRAKLYPCEVVACVPVMTE